MCGIVGYIGKNPTKKLVQGLKKLEYRGYDSAGIAIISNEEIRVQKAVGEIDNLEKTCQSDDSAFVGIGHTRWATHGKPTLINAHPHLSNNKQFAVVHNGIIVNYTTIKSQLEKNGVAFYSQTDTEVVAKLLEFNFNGDTLESLGKTISQIEGSYSFAILNNKENRIYFARNKSPLFACVNDGAVMLSSDVITFHGVSQAYYEIPDGAKGYCEKNKIICLDKYNNKLKLKEIKLSIDMCQNLTKFDHYMVKEIYDTKNMLKNICEFYSITENRDKFSLDVLKKINKIILVGCGTAYHACLVGAKYFANKLKMPVFAIVSSEFVDEIRLIDKSTMVILVSQSGETADTISVYDNVLDKAGLVASIVNVEHSFLAKNSPIFFPLKAGVEVAVASTKAYCAQVVLLYIICETIFEKLTISKYNMSNIIELIKEFEYPNENIIKLLAQNFNKQEKLFFIGRGYDYLNALEASLKIKETSYKQVDCYYAGELKHGFLALVDENSCVVAFATEKKVSF